MQIRNRRVQLFLDILEQRDLPSSSLSGVVFADTSNNGIQDPGETGLAGAVVRLTGVDNQNHGVNLSQHTNSAGQFSFVNLAPGVYSLQESAASGYVDGLTTAGSQGGSATLGSISNITLADGVSGTGYELGELAASAGWTSIQSNFNGTSIPAGDTIWFTSAFKANGLGSSPVTLQFTGQTISYVLNGSTVTFDVPNSTVTLSPTATTAATSFNAATDTWVTTLPTSFSGNGFLGAVELPLPNGLPGGINSVTWQGQLTSDTPGVSINWQWAAAAYQSFNTDYNALNVKPVDDNHLSVYQNSDHAGTPEAYKTGVVGGARGGGGSNFTGSMSSTSTIQPPVQQQQLASISGFVYNQGNGLGIGGIEVDLEDSSGNIVASMVTNPDGSYSFTDISPGTYQLVAVPGQGLLPIGEQVGTVNEMTDGTDLGNLTLGGINLANGNVGINYDFYLGGGG